MSIMIRNNKILPILLLFISLALSSCTERKILIGVSQCSDDIWRQKVNQEIHIGEHQYNNVDVLSLAMVPSIIG